MTLPQRLTTSPQLDPLEPALHPTAHVPAPHPHRATPAGWWDRVAVGGLAAAGFLLSYDALRQMAAAAHVRPALTWLFPLIVDGFIAYGVRALLLMRRARPAARAYVWLLFALATGASIWANVLHAVVLNQEELAFISGPGTHNDGAGLRLGDTVVGVLSAVAPLALAGAVHLHTLIHQPRPDTATGTATTVAALSDAPPGTRLPDVDGATEYFGVPGQLDHRGTDSPTGPADTNPMPLQYRTPSDRNSGHQPSEPHAYSGQSAATDRSGPLLTGLADGTRHERVSAPDSSGRAADIGANPDFGGPTPADPSPSGRSSRRGRRPVADDEVLLDVARSAVADTGRVSRATVRDAIRAEGLSVGNDRLTLLMAQLRSS
ncbi:DUF2637 domain-containing protein [Yinghuangia sp. YIM S10712]|uniref:DUF2637 domain-containing protein n=1 Tax=Yinghuangia sp. YIM S10712 TaxID=3436930 RepID=UPI003F52CBF8